MSVPRRRIGQRTHTLANPAPIDFCADPCLMKVRHQNPASAPQGTSLGRTVLDHGKDHAMTQSSKKPRQRPRVITPTHRHHASSTRPVPLGRPQSTGQSLATFRGRWAGDDLDERLAEVYQVRGHVGSD